jgi:hypothetical protein
LPGTAVTIEATIRLDLTVYPSSEADLEAGIRLAKLNIHEALDDIVANGEFWDSQSEVLFGGDMEAEDYQVEVKQVGTGAAQSATTGPARKEVVRNAGQAVQVQYSTDVLGCQGSDRNRREANANRSDSCPGRIFSSVQRLIVQGE